VTCLKIQENNHNGASPKENISKFPELFVRFLTKIICALIIIQNCLEKVQANAKYKFYSGSQIVLKMICVHCAILIFR
jgi:hypothetical protein